MAGVAMAPDWHLKVRLIIWTDDSLERQWASMLLSPCIFLNCSTIPLQLKLQMAHNDRTTADCCDSSGGETGFELRQYRDIQLSNDA